MAGDDERIFGFHAVEEALTAGEPLRRIYIPQQRERDPRLARLIAAARRADIPLAFERLPRQRGPGNRAGRHDVSADVQAFQYTPWSDVRSAVRTATSALVVAVDHIEDPQNLGAIVRNAEGAGALAMVVPDRRNAGVTAVTRRASAGAASHLRIARVPNLVMALLALKEDGCWVTGLSPNPGAPSYDTADYTKKCVLVVGAEGKGLSRLVSERCDALVRIPLRGKVRSLNAASAAAVVLFAASRQASAVAADL
jgi:23S rRNA (guanosine2251-2'-O)-methyltransferase